MLFIAGVLTTAVALAPASHAHQRHGVAGRPPISPIQASNTLGLQLLGEINGVRTQHGLRPLRASRQLAAAASQHSTSMAEKGYFSHKSANGGSFWQRIAAFYGYRGYRQWAVGENLLWSSPDVSAAAGLRMWLTSREHRANVLNRSWREIGLSAVHAASAPGVYGGSEVTIVTADFGARS